MVLYLLEPSFIGHSRVDVSSTLTPRPFSCISISLVSPLPVRFSLSPPISFIPSAWRGLCYVFKYRGVSVAHGAPLMSPPCAPYSVVTPPAEKQSDLFARRSSTPRQFTRATSATAARARARLSLLPWPRDPYFVPVLPSCNSAAPLCRCHPVLHSAQRRRFYLLYLHIARTRHATRRVDAFKKGIRSVSGPEFAHQPLQ